MNTWFTGRLAGLVLPALALITGIALAIAGTQWLQTRQHAEAEANFDRMARRSAADVAARFREPVSGLLGLRSLYAMQPRLHREDFRTYVAARDLPTYFPGARGFGFIARVPANDLASFVAAERADGEPQFAVRHFGPQAQADHFIIRFIEPAAANVGALGLDVGSEPVRRAGLIQALSSGEPTLSGSITLVQDQRRSAGMLLFVPVFRPLPGEGPTGSGRGQALGLLYAPIVIAELLDDLADTASGQAQIDLFDNAAGGLTWAPIYESHPDTDGADGQRQLRHATFEAELPLALPGRELMMRVRSTPAFDARNSSRTPTLFLVGTLLGSLLLAALLRQLAHGGRLAEVRAERMTEDLKRLALVARRTTNAVIITNANRRITWVNEGFERITGFSAAEALGQSPGLLLQTDETDPATIQRVRSALKAGEGVSCELFNRGKCGRRYWLSVEIQPLVDDTGMLTGFMAIEQDITERKQAEAALRANRALLDKTGRIGGIGGWALDLAAQRVEWTDETCRIHDLPTGHHPTLAEALGFFTPRARASIEAAMQQILDQGAGFDVELPLVTAAGRSIWVRAVGEAELHDGKPLRVVGAFQDITARREMAGQLRRSNALLGSVMQSLPCGLSVFDADLKLALCNDEFGRLLELPERLCRAGEVAFEDIIRFNAGRGEYGAGDAEATVQAIVERARQPATPHLLERVRPNGTVLEVRGAPMAGGGFVTTYTDVSARARAEAEALRSGQVLRGAIDAIDEAFVLYDPEDRLVLCNERYRETYAGVADLIVPGNRFEDIVRAGAERGDYLAAVGRIDEWVAERVAIHQRADSTIVQKLDGGKTLRIIERKLPDGHIVGFRIDITELVNATEAAQQASLAKSRFLANMSHEIRTPMNAVLGMLALLKRTPLTARQADYADKTEGAARSLLGLLDDILDFSKVEAGRMTLDPQPLRIDQLLRDLSVILAAGVGEKPVELLFDIDPALPKCLVGDALRLRQVLINLGGNAIKFTAEGEVVVQFKLLASDAHQVTLQVAVRDTGIGIAAENQARIFSGFNQAEASTTRRFGGTGLGVAISQRLVGLMGGNLQVDSVPGQGSCFHFQIDLPLDPAVVLGGADGDAGARAPAEAPALRALVVDDHATARAVLASMCETLGWNVDTAEGGEQALALLAEQARLGRPYDMVFVDWQMPGLDGFETARQIDERGLGGHGPVVLMVTAHGREMLAQRSLDEQQRLDGFLVKPVTASMLFDAVVDARRGRQPPQPHLTQRGHEPPDRRLAGLRLLVAEDNPNNQQVALELLEDEGAEVVIVADGQAAVQAVESALPAFDAVLMDLQMPVMDGFTATGRIRKDLGRSRLPIIAMTANVMASDRDACLAAGMNDHVGKPFDLDHLVAVLRRLTGRVEAGPSASQATALPAAVIDAAATGGIAIHSAVARLGGHLAVYRRSLTSFASELDGLPGLLQQDAAAGDAAAIGQRLHTLKGLAATLGIDALVVAARTGEQRLAAASGSAACGQACEAIEAAIERTRTGLSALLLALQAGDKAAAPTDTSAPAGAPAEETLRELVSLLENSDMRATELMSTLQARHGQSLGPAWSALAEAVAALDYAAALRLCQPLLARSPA